MALTKFGQVSFLKKVASQAGSVMDRPKVESASTTVHDDDFLWFTARAIVADKPNGNGDFFSRKEILASYKSFIGKHIDLNHSTEPEDIVGKIVEAYIVEDNGETWVEIVGKMDKKQYPDIARKIETGLLDCVSMESIVEASACSVCGHTIRTPEDRKCQHLETSLLKECDHEGEKKLCYAINTGITFTGLGIVMVPAEPDAKIRAVLAQLKAAVEQKTISTTDFDTIFQQINDLLNKTDEKTQQEVKAQLAIIQSQINANKEGSEMKPVKVEELDPRKSALEKLNALEYIALMESLEKKEKEAIKINTDPATVAAISVPAGHELKIENKDGQTMLTAEKKSEVSSNMSETNKVADKQVETPKYSAMFVPKAAKEQGKWIFLKDGKVLISATLDQIWGKSLAEQEPYATSKEFAKNVISRLDTMGVEKVAELWKVSVKGDAFEKSHKEIRKMHEKNESDSEKTAKQLEVEKNEKASALKPSEKAQLPYANELEEPKGGPYAKGNAATRAVSEKNERESAKSRDGVKTEYEIGLDNTKLKEVEGIGDYAKEQANPTGKEYEKGAKEVHSLHEQNERASKKSRESVDVEYEVGTHLKAALTVENMEKAAAELCGPKPTDPAPEGRRWVCDAQTKQWVAASLNKEANPMYGEPVRDEKSAEDPAMAMPGDKKFPAEKKPEDKKPAMPADKKEPKKDKKPKTYAEAVEALTDGMEWLEANMPEAKKAMKQLADALEKVEAEHEKAEEEKKAEAEKAKKEQDKETAKKEKEDKKNEKKEEGKEDKKEDKKEEKKEDKKEDKKDDKEAAQDDSVVKAALETEAKVIGVTKPDLLPGEKSIDEAYGGKAEEPEAPGHQAWDKAEPGKFAKETKADLNKDAGEIRTNPDQEIKPKLEAGEANYRDLMDKDKVDDPTKHVTKPTKFTVTKGRVASLELKGGYIATRDLDAKTVTVVAADGSSVGTYQDAFGDNDESVKQFIESTILPQAEKEKQLQAELFNAKMSAALKEKRDKCAAIVHEMLKKGMIELDRAAVQAAMHEGKTLLDAQSYVVNLAISAQIKDLLAFTDEQLESWSKTVNRMPKKMAKQASKNGVDMLEFVGFEPQGEQDWLTNVFNKMD